VQATQRSRLKAAGPFDNKESSASPDEQHAFILNNSLDTIESRVRSILH